MGSVLTDDSARLQKIWPEVARRAVVALRRRGVPLADAEDAVAEAATRLIDRSVAFDDVEDLLPWVHTVAWRVVVDWRRRDSRLVYDVTDEAARDDTAVAAEARIRAHRLAGLVRALPEADRAVLFNAVPSKSRKDATRLAVRRHRLRAHLIAALDAIAGLLAWIINRVVERPRKVRVAAALSVPTALLVAAAALPHYSGHESESVVTPPDSAVTVAEGFSSATYRAGHSPALFRAGEGGGRPAGPARLPGWSVSHPAPEGGGRVWGREKEPDDRFVCVAILDAVDRCADLPVQLTD